MVKKLFVAGALCGLLSAAGCRTTPNAPVNEQVQGVRQTLDQAGEKVRAAASNASLAGSVKSALDSRKGLETRGIKVDVKGDVVTLTGDVTGREQAEMAEQVARETKGVAAVNNQLTVRVPAKSLPPGPAATSEPPGTEAAPAPGR
jgi:hypothetical protein